MNNEQDGIFNEGFGLQVSESKQKSQTVLKQTMIFKHYLSGTELPGLEHIYSDSSQYSSIGNTVIDATDCLI